MRVSLVVTGIALGSSAASAQARPGSPSSAPEPALTARREKPLPWYGARIGALVAMGTAASGTPDAVGFGTYMLIDATNILADVTLDAYAGNQAQLYAFGLGLYWPFEGEVLTPYLGGNVKLGWTKFGGNGTLGYIPCLAGGVLLGRQGELQVRLELAWFFVASGENASGRSGEWRPTGPMLTMGIAM